MADLLIVHRQVRPASGTKLYGPDNRLLEPTEALALTTLYWGPVEGLRAVAIAQCESGLWTGAWAWEGEDSRGLLQLNVEAHPELMFYNLFDPQVNLYFAHLLWIDQDWNPWTCAHELGYV